MSLDWMRSVGPDWHKHALAWMHSPEGQAYFKKVEKDPRLMDHADYLETPLWKKQIRPHIMERDNGKCQRCGERATEVHHLSYEGRVMLGENDSELVALCRGCHEMVGRDEKGLARSKSEQRRLLGFHDPTEFPKPVVTRIGKRKRAVLYPEIWERMSTAQQGLWIKEAFKLSKTIRSREWATAWQEKNNSYPPTGKKL
jgi:hypothetical protein